MSKIHRFERFAQFVRTFSSKGSNLTFLAVGSTVCKGRYWELFGSDILKAPPTPLSLYAHPLAYAARAIFLLRNTLGGYSQTCGRRAAFASCRPQWDAGSYSSSMLTFMSFRLCKQTTPRPSIAFRHAGHSRQNTEPTGVRSRLWRHNDFLLT